MRRTFILNILLLVFVNVLIKPFFIFGIDLTVQNRTDQGEYGLYFALLNWTYLFQIINDFGLQNYNTRHVSSHPHLLEKYFPNLLIIKILLSGVYFIVALLAARLVGGYHGSALWLLSVLLVNQILVQLVLFLRSSIAGLGFYRTDSLLSSLDKLLMLFFCGGALWWFGKSGMTYFPIMWFAVAQTMALLCTALIVYSILWKKSALPFRPELLINLKSGLPVIRLLFRKSLPFAIVILLMSAYTRMDGVLLERLLPDGGYHADIFAGSYRLLDALNMFGYLFASLLLPMFTRLLAEKSEIRSLTALSFKLIWVGSFTACAAIFFNAQDIIGLMFRNKPDILYRAAVCQILIWCFLSICVIYIFSTLLTAGERLKDMNRIFIAGLVIDLVLNILLIPQLQAKGAAIAALSTQTFVALGMVWLCYRIYGMQPGWSGVVRMVVFSGGLLIFSREIVEWTTFAWPMKFGAILLAGLVLALFSGLLDWRTALKTAQSIRSSQSGG